MTSLDFYDWLYSEPVYMASLTISDVQMLEPGRSQYLVSLDRHVADRYFGRPHNRGPKPKPRHCRPVETAEAVFRDDIACLTPAQDPLHGGLMLWPWEQDPDVLDGMGRPFTWEVEWSPNVWHPAEVRDDGVACLPEVPSDVQDGGPDEWDGYPAGVPLAKLDPDTRLGWRGPMFLASQLPDLPNIFGCVADMNYFAAQCVMDRIYEILPELATPSQWDQDRLYVSLSDGQWRITVWDANDDEVKLVRKRFPDADVEGRTRLFVPGQLNVKVVAVARAARHAGGRTTVMRVVEPENPETGDA